MKKEKNSTQTYSSVVNTTVNGWLRTMRPKAPKKLVDRLLRNTPISPSRTVSSTSARRCDHVVVTS